MFQRWGFMMGEIWLLLLLAALLGLLAGWLIWGRRAPSDGGHDETASLRSALDSCTAKGRDQTARIAALEGDLAAAQAKVADSAAQASAKTAAASAAASVASAAAAGDAVKAAPAPKAEAAKTDASKATAPKTKTVAESGATTKAKAAQDSGAAGKAATGNATTGKAVAGKAPTDKAAPAKPAIAKAATTKAPATKTEAAKTGSGKSEFGKTASTASNAAKPTAPKAADKPKGLTKARGGKPDDLKLIKGVGPKLEALCNKLGYFHFDQIASWTEKEIAWVDDNLEGFKGRVTREDWVQQARDLMNGLPPRPGGEK